MAQDAAEWLGWRYAKLWAASVPFFVNAGTYAASAGRHALAVLREEGLFTVAQRGSFVVPGQRKTVRAGRSDLLAARGLVRPAGR